MFVDNKGENWLKRAHIGQYLGIAHIITLTAKLSGEGIRSRGSLRVEVGIHRMGGGGGGGGGGTPPPRPPRPSLGKTPRILIFSFC